MEDSNINSTSWNKSLDETITDENNNENMDFLAQVLDVVFWIIICVGLLVTLVAMFAVLSLVKRDHGAPVYILNLLISDLVQLCSRILMMLGVPGHLYLHFGLLLGLFASVGFMVCVSLERYLLIAKPLWYRLSRNIKTPVLVCVAVWVLFSILILTVFLTLEKQTIILTILAVVLLLPLPLFIFFLAGTVKALSEARSVPADEKRRIVSILVVVFLTYVLLFLPYILSEVIPTLRGNFIFQIFTTLCVLLSPLADSSLYILLRKSAFDNLFACLCCCKMSVSQEVSNTAKSNTSATCAAAV